MEPVAKRGVHHSGASAGCLPPPDGAAAAAPALRGPGPLQTVPAGGQHEAHPQADAQILPHVTDHTRVYSRINTNSSAVMFHRSALTCRQRGCRPLWNFFLFFSMHLVAI